MSTEIMDFGDATPVEVAVKISGKQYTLKEALGDAVTKFNGLRAQAGRFQDGKFVGVRGSMANAEPFLVSLCLCDENGKPVPEKVIRAWPSRIQKQLYEKVKDLSEIDDREDLESLEKQLKEITKKIAKLKGEDPTKNALESLTAGSE